jgi:hypothetical protein
MLFRTDIDIAVDQCGCGIEPMFPFADVGLHLGSLPCLKVVRTA